MVFKSSIDSNLYGLTIWLKDITCFETYTQYFYKGQGGTSTIFVPYNVP